MSDADAPRGPAAAPDILEQIQAEVFESLEEERPPAGGLAYQIVGAGVALLVGLVGAAMSVGFGLGSLRSPGPGLWPFAVSLLITVLAVLLLVTCRQLTDSERFTRASLLPVAGLVTFVALGALMPVIGFEIPSLLLCVVWLRFLGGESWRSTVAVSVVTVAVFYLLFLYGLRIPLPHMF